MRRVLLAVGAHTNTCIMLCEFPNRSSVPGGKKRSGILPTHTTVAMPSVRALIAKLGVDAVGCEQTQATCEEQRRARMREWGSRAQIGTLLTQIGPLLGDSLSHLLLTV